MQRFSALATEKEAAMESLRVVQLKLETAIKVSLLFVISIDRALVFSLSLLCDLHF